MIAIDGRLTSLCAGLACYEEVTTFTGGQLSNDDLCRCQATALFVRSTTKVHSALLANTAVKFVATATSGTDHIDREWCAANGITVVDAAGTNANAVAEWVMGVFAAVGVTTSNTVGVVGYGHVGQRVVRMCQTLGISTVVNDPPRLRAGLDVPNAVNLDTLLENSTVVTLHVPLTGTGEDSTVNLLTSRELALLPKGALVINAARGGVLNEADAMKWIAKGGRVVADTFAGEPDIDVAYARACALATPHVAGHTLNAFLDASIVVGQAWCTWKGYPSDSIYKACAVPTVPASFQLDSRLHNVATTALERRGILADVAAMQTLVIDAPSNHVGVRFSQMRKEYPLRPETFLL